MIRVDVNDNQVSGKIEHVYTVPADDPKAAEVNENMFKMLNDAGRYSEADQIHEAMEHAPMADPRTGTGLPGEMESSDHEN